FRYTLALTCGVAREFSSIARTIVDLPCRSNELGPKLGSPKHGRRKKAMVVATLARGYFSGGSSKRVRPVVEPNVRKLVVHIPYVPEDVIAELAPGHISIG